MANLIIQENGVARTTPAVHGEEITIQAPCDCSEVTGVQIAGVVYPFYDAAGKVLPMGTGLFTTGNLIRVLIDTVNTRATIINRAITPSMIGAYTTEETDAALQLKSNPNLLDNWYFANPVNQRGQTEYTGEGYTIDRWRTHGNLTVTIDSDSLALFAEGDSNIVQPLENALKEDTLFTFSVLNKTGTVYIRIRDTEWGNYGVSQRTGEGVVAITGTVPKGKIPMAQIYSGQGESIAVKAAKLELGSQQTLAHLENGVWVLNEIPDYNEQLLRCCMSTADSADTYANNNILHTGNANSLGVPYIQTGSYVGTGKTGSDNPITLTFNFAPKLLFLAPALDASTDYGNVYQIMGAMTTAYTQYAYNLYNVYGKKSSDGKSFTFYANPEKVTNLEETWYIYDVYPIKEGVTYHWVAIG